MNFCSLNIYNLYTMLNEMLPVKLRERYNFMYMMTLFMQ